MIRRARSSPVSPIPQLCRHLTTSHGLAKPCNRAVFRNRPRRRANGAMPCGRLLHRIPHRLRRNGRSVEAIAGHRQIVLLDNGGRVAHPWTNDMRGPVIRQLGLSNAPEVVILPHEPAPVTPLEAGDPLGRGEHVEGAEGRLRVGSPEHAGHPWQRRAVSSNPRRNHYARRTPSSNGKMVLKREFKDLQTSARVDGDAFSLPGPRTKRIRDCTCRENSDRCSARPADVCAS